MRKTRAEYHQAVKNVKREEVKIRNRKLANYVTGKDSRYLWKELKVIKGFNKCIPYHRWCSWEQRNCTNIWK